MPALRFFKEHAAWSEWCVSLVICPGELVVDKDPGTGTYRLRFLAYDVMALHGQHVGSQPFNERYEARETRSHLRRSSVPRRPAPCVRRRLRPYAMVQAATEALISHKLTGGRDLAPSLSADAGRTRGEAQADVP